MYEMIKALCDAKGISMSALAKDLGLGINTFTKLKRLNTDGTKKELSAKTLAAVADYFGISVDELLGKEKKPSEDTEIDIDALSDDDLTKLMLQKFRTIKSPELQRQALDYLVYLESKDSEGK